MSTEKYKVKLQRISGFSGIFKILRSYDFGKTYVEPIQGFRFRVNCPKTKKKFNVITFAEAKQIRRGEGPNRPEPSAEAVVSSMNSVPDKIVGMTFNELIETWVKKILFHKESSTQVRYKSYFRLYKFFHGMAVDSITTEVVDDWVLWLKQPERLATMHSTRCDFKHEIDLLVTIFRYYQDKKSTFVLPIKQRHRDNSKVKEKPLKIKDMSDQELHLFLDTLKRQVWNSPNEIYYFVAGFQYHCYGRVQEAAAIHLEDFDFSKNIITVNKKIVWDRCKGSEPKLRTGSKCNSGKPIPISLHLKSLLNEWVVRSGVKSGPLFTFKGKFLSYRSIEYRYTEALKAAGINQSATHVMRHAALTGIYEQTGDLKVTAAYAGHENIMHTARYAKVRQTRLQEVQNRRDKALDESLFKKGLQLVGDSKAKAIETASNDLAPIVDLFQSYG